MAHYEIIEDDGPQSLGKFSDTLQYFIHNFDGFLANASRPGLRKTVQDPAETTQRLSEFIVHLVSKTAGHLFVPINQVPRDVYQFGRLPFQFCEGTLDDPHRQAGCSSGKEKTETQNPGKIVNQVLCLLHDHRFYLHSALRLNQMLADQRRCRVLNPV